MLKECIETFKKSYYKDDCKDKLITDDYTVSDGTYVLLTLEDDKIKYKEHFEISLNKKTKEIEGCYVEDYRKICRFDYNSKLISINKPIDAKKVIQSNNYLSFIIKKESLHNNKLTLDIIDNYYETLKNPELKYTKPKSRDMYASVENDLESIDLELLDKMKDFIKENIFKLDNFQINTIGKDYLKIFLDTDINLYENECTRYVGTNIYNSNDFNIKIDDTIYGIPSDNMNLNSKKPFLENKSRKISIPNLLRFEEVLIQKKFFDYLYNQVSKGRVNIYINEEEIKPLKNGSMIKKDFSGYYLRLKKGTEVEIIDFDIINSYKFKLEKEFKLINILEIEEKYNKLELEITEKGEAKKIEIDIYKTYNNRLEMQIMIDGIIFSKFLVNNYFNDPSDMSIKDIEIKRSILVSRNRIFNYIYKGDESGFYGVVNKVLENLIVKNILDGRIIKASHQYNLKLSLKNYFKGGENMNDVIREVKNSLREKINSNETESISNDREYYFSIGQLISYLLSKSKSKNAPIYLINGFINAKNDKLIKTKLRNLYKKYNYDKDFSTKRFKNLYAMVVSYIPSNGIDEDSIIAGFLHSNLIYETNKGAESNE